MRTRILRVIAVLVAGICELADSDIFAADLTPATTNNTAVGTVMSVSHTWDPGESLTITGKLWDPDGDNCTTTTSIANADSVVVRIIPPEQPNQTGHGHLLCGTPNRRRAFTPGTDGSSNFSFTIRGGGVSFLSGDGITNVGSIFELTFKEGSTGKWSLEGGTSTRWPELFDCEAGYAPDLYGHLASPDLTGDTNVDSSDLSAFSDYLGDAITREWGWQADFNHSGGYVDAGDLSYFSARWGKSCSSSKAGDAYMADVNNLENAGIQALMARAGITAADVLAYWDAQGWTYDRDVATRIASASLERRDWGSVKQIFR